MNLFPRDNSEDMVSTAEETANSYKANTPAFDFIQGDFSTRDGKILIADGERALQLWIEKCLRTRSEGYPIYTQDTVSYGVDMPDLTDRQSLWDYTKAQLQMEIAEALLRNPEILAVEGFTFERQKRSLFVGFTVSSIYGDHSLQMPIDTEQEVTL